MMVLTVLSPTLANLDGKDDSLNPFIPKVGNFVLQPPTQPHIRRLKAQNFIYKVERCNSSRAKRAPLAEVSGNRTAPNPSVTTEVKSETVDDEESYELPATTYSHQRCRALLASERGSPSSKFVGGATANVTRQSDVTEQSSQQEFVEVSEAPLENEIDPALLLAFQMLNGNQSSPTSEQPSLRGGQGDICRLKQVETSPTSLRTNEEEYTPVPKDSSLESSQRQVEISPTSPCTTGEEHTTIHKDSSPESNRRQVIMIDQTSPRTSNITNPEILDSLEKTKSTDVPSQPNDHRPCARVISNSQEPSKLRRAKNREARLIDGNIILPGHRKRLSSQRDSPPENVNIGANVDETRTQVARRSWTPSRQKHESPRHSWLQSVRTIFRSGSQGKNNAKSPSRKPTSPKGPSKGAHTQAQEPAAAAAGRARNSNSQGHHSPVAAATPPPPPPPPSFSHPQGLDGALDSKYWARRRYSLPLRRLSLNLKKRSAS